MIVEQLYRIKLSEVAKDNKITNKALLGILEDVGCKHSDIAKCGILDIPTTKLTWVLIEWKVKIINRPKYSDSIIAKTWSKESKKCYAFRDFELINMDSGEIIALGTSKWALVNIETGKLERVSEELLGRYEPELDKFALENEEFEKIKEPEDYQSIIEYEVKRSDIDVNNHMHNLNYIELANEALPLELYKKDEANNIRITYRREIKYGDTVLCKYANIDDKAVVCIKSKDDKVLHALIELK